MPAIDMSLIQPVAIGLAVVVLLALLLTLVKRRRAAASGEHEASGEAEVGDAGSGEAEVGDAEGSEDEDADLGPVAAGNDDPGPEAVTERHGRDLVPETAERDAERAPLSREPVVSRSGGFSPKSFTPATENDPVPVSSLERNVGFGRSPEDDRVTAGIDTFSTDPDEHPDGEESGETGAGDIHDGEPAAAAAPEPEAEPFERDGRWWFRRDGELLVFDESSGEWAPAENAPAGVSDTRGSKGAIAGVGSTAVLTEARPAETPAAARPYWKCTTCSAVNGSTAKSCRMCFRPRP